MPQEVNPYAPPTEEAAGEEETERRLPRRNPFEDERRPVLVCILLAMVTCGLYSGIWLIRRQRFLDSLRADAKLGWRPTVLILLYVATLGVAFIGGATQSPEVIAVDRFLSLAGGIVTLVTNFRVAAILRSEFARSGRLLSVSSLGTFFLGIFYLQYKINQGADVAGHRKKKKKRAHASPPPP